MTAIEWTDQTWNPATGCSKVSAGCKNCYAERIAARQKELNPAGRYANGFDYTEHSDKVADPLKWKRPRMVFVNSMSDFFHERATYPFQLACLDVMRRCPQHQFQVLTKRPERAAALVERMRGSGGDWPDNAWLGVSVEDHRQVHRIRALVNLGEAVRIKFVSFEPLIGAVTSMDLGSVGAGVQWAIVGGESGPGHRPIEADWARMLRDYYVPRKIPFFFKQWGGITPKSGGRELDGKVWDEYPDRPGIKPRTLCEVLGNG